MRVQMLVDAGIRTPEGKTYRKTGEIVEVSEDEAKRLVLLRTAAVVVEEQQEAEEEKPKKRKR